MKPIKRGMTEAVTRDGRKVTQLIWFETDVNPYPVHGVINGHIFTWTESGVSVIGQESKADIFAPVEYEWQWLVKDNEGNFAVTAFREDESDIYEYFPSRNWSIHSRIEESKREVES